MSWNDAGRSFNYCESTPNGRTLPDGCVLCVNSCARRKGEEPDFSEALIVRNKSSIEDVCDQVHRTLKETFKYAMVW